MSLYEERQRIGNFQRRAILSGSDASDTRPPRKAFSFEIDTGEPLSTAFPAKCCFIVCVICSFEWISDNKPTFPLYTLLEFKSAKGTILDARDVAAIEAYLTSHLDALLSMIPLTEQYYYREDNYVETIYTFDFCLLTYESIQ
jgi:hypothetical protein